MWQRQQSPASAGLLLFLRYSPDAADLYRSGLSACQIATLHKLTRPGAEEKIRKGGLHGLQWCPDHRKYEEV
jgi:hypothetical protein